VSIVKVISGGQVGADIGALKAAKRYGVETGGFMTRDWRTKEGPKPEYAEEYGMEACLTNDYPSRTFRNVESSDGTLRIAYNFGTPGERCTLNAIESFRKPHFDVKLHLDDALGYKADDVIAAFHWVQDNDIQVLNVAGNANANIEDRVFAFVYLLLNVINKPAFAGGIGGYQEA